jgi:hypothetical protein
MRFFKTNVTMERLATSASHCETPDDSLRWGHMMHVKHIDAVAGPPAGSFRMRHRRAQHPPRALDAGVSDG